MIRAEGIGQRVMAKFRFQDLEIWKEAIEIGNILFDIADGLEEKKLFRFTEQLRGAGMSMSNNIAEGCGSNSGKEKPSLGQANLADIRNSLESTEVFRVSG